MTPLPQTPLSLWVDGDNCHKKALNALVQHAERKVYTLCVCADRFLELPASVHFVQVDHGSGTTDHIMLSRCKAGDIAVTRDLSLAQSLLDNKVHVMNDRGTIWNARSLQRQQQNAAIIRAMNHGGMKTWRSRSWTTEHTRDFIRSLQTLLHQLTGQKILLQSRQ